MSRNRKPATLTVAELIVLLHQFPPSAAVHLSEDEEGNRTHPLLAAQTESVRGAAAVVLYPRQG